MWKSVVKFRWVKCSENLSNRVSSWVKCSENLSNRVSNIITGYRDHTKFAAFMTFPFTIFLHVLLVIFFYHCIYGCMLCMLLIL